MMSFIKQQVMRFHSVYSLTDKWILEDHFMLNTKSEQKKVLKKKLFIRK